MQKLIFYTDCHVTNIAPKSRKDNYYEAMLNKLDQIDKISRKEKVDLVICGGDLTHKPNEQFVVFNDLYSYYRNTYKKHIMIAGETHDFYANYQNISKSIMGALYKTDCFQLVGQSYDIVVDGVRVHSSHRAICEYPFFGSYTLYKDFNHPCDIVLLSHLHMEFGIKEVNGRIFVSPGSMSRNDCSSFNIGRIPKIVLVSCKDSKIDKIELIPLDVELDVFDEKYLIKKQESSEKPEMESLEKLEEFVGVEDQVMDADAIIRRIGERYRKEVVEKAMEFKNVGTH